MKGTVNRSCRKTVGSKVSMKYGDLTRQALDDVDIQSLELKGLSPVPMTKEPQTLTAGGIAR